MPMDNFPDSKEEAVDIIAKAGYFKASNDKVEVSMESSNTINIQPKGNVFGVKVKVEDNNTVTPTLTFDTKKLRDKNKRFDPEGTIDDALKNFWENNNV